MSEIEKMKRYIKRTNLDQNDRYDMSFTEVMELSSKAAAEIFPAEIISLVFKYGKAKGYRAAKAEVRR